MSVKRVFQFGAALFGLLVATQAAHAIVAESGTILFGNVNSPSQGPYSTINVATSSGGLAASFKSNGNNTLTDLQLLLSASSNDDSAGVMVTVFDDFGDTPNNWIGTVGFISDNEVVADTLLSGPNAGLSLVDMPGLSIPLLPADGDTADGRYWIQMQDCSTLGDACSDPPPATTIGWSLDSNPSYPGEWNQINGEALLNSDGLDGSPGTFQMCVVGNGNVSSCTVPEPTSLSLMGFGLAGLGLLLRRRRVASS